MKNILTLISLILISQNAYSSTCKYGVQFFNNGEYSRAFNIFKLSSEKDACSQRYLSIMYKNGLYVKQNDKKSKVYLELSIKNGFTPESILDKTRPN